MVLILGPGTPYDPDGGDSMVVMLIVINVASLAISRTKAVFQGLTAFRVSVEIVELISLAKAALFRGFPFPGAAAFAFGGEGSLLACDGRNL